MKKILLLITILFAVLSAFSAQITQEESDKIVFERMKKETRPYTTIHAKEGVQTEGMTVTTSAEEEIELDYACWVYFVHYTGETENTGRYLIVNGNNGNLLEVNAKSDAVPGDLMEWRTVAAEVEFTEYSLVKTSCLWAAQLIDDYESYFDGAITIINSSEEMEKYITCTKGSYPEIDFSKQILLLANGYTRCGISKIFKSLQQFSTTYVLNVKITLNETAVVQWWCIARIINKLNEESNVELNLTVTFTNE